MAILVLHQAPLSLVRAKQFPGVHCLLGERTELSFVRLQSGGSELNHGDSFGLLPWYSVPHPRLEGVGEREGDVAEAAQRGTLGQGN